MKRSHVALAAAVAAALAHAEETKPAGLPNPFYAMDTAFAGRGLSTEQAFALVAKLGYAGIAWHEEAPARAKASAEAMEKAGLKMIAIYCAAKVSPEGELTVSPTLKELMAALKSHGTIVWLHIGGRGPAFDTLKGDEPVIKALRELADVAAANGLRIAIYPHVGEWTARFADATKLALAVKHPRFGVTFNLCHAMAMGEEKAIPELLEKAKDVLFIVSICGAESGVTGGNWGKLIQTLDKGTFDQVALLKKLKAIGFRGPIGFQGYAIKGTPEEILAPTIKAWLKFSAAAAQD